LLLDGRNRLAAMELAGLPTDGVQQTTLYGNQGANPVAYALSANLHRRHLTAEQRRELIAKLIKATPEKSDRQIAETVKVSHVTVGAVRAEMESRGQIDHVETRTDTKGREQPAKKTSVKAKAEPNRQAAAAARQLLDFIGVEGAHRVIAAFSSSKPSILLAALGAAIESYTEPEHSAVHAVVERAIARSEQQRLDGR
jgi:hypothetical protein